MKKLILIGEYVDLKIEKRIQFLEKLNIGHKY